ncbi:TPA: site-specific integrase [Salmonella enterica subsp. salamae serovar 35:g,m,s,t:-]|nr:site-specific integrase [Salmonella enterica subsp. salamae serovar 35:g,m,s,t:-]HCA3549787.1 site-specific integrase [Salmonella enterica subsp. salamae serovar 35:g,m,s,t:-]
MPQSTHRIDRKVGQICLGLRGGKKIETVKRFHIFTKSISFTPLSGDAVTNLLRKRIKKIRLIDALDKYYETVSKFKKGANQEFYRINVIKRQPIAQRYMDELTTVDIADYRDSRLRQSNSKSGQKISGNTVRLEMALMSNMFNIARVEWGTCRGNPVELVRKPKPSPGRERRLSKKEERKFDKYFQEKSIELYCIFHLAIETAMRQGEILNLTWEHVYSRFSQVFLPETKNGHPRSVPLSNRAKDILKIMQGQGRDNFGKIFSYTSNGFKSAWRAAKTALGIEDLHFHDLRHEAISRLYELGTLTDLEIAAISGHRTLNMLKRYAHIKTSHLSRKINGKRRKSSVAVVDHFVPYPARISEIEDGISLSFPDFEELVITGVNLATAAAGASIALLREIAMRLKQGLSIPLPSDMVLHRKDYTVIAPL